MLLESPAPLAHIPTIHWRNEVATFQVDGIGRYALSMRQRIDSPGQYELAQRQIAPHAAGY
jgi:hypothetical protein